KNFDSNKDWELSGKSFRSELLMRRYGLHQSFRRKWYKHLFIFNSHFYEWFFYWVYGRFSGFTQSIVTPFVLFIAVIVIFTVGYYYESSSFWDSLQKSLVAALPLFKTELTYSNWWVKSSETFICSILLVFFILSLRKRFKQ
ncbi:MAG: hypothetical protein AAF934_01335, partial [Bacteroidota bacterium]